MTEEELGERVRQIVDEAPPLTVEQVDRLAHLLRPTPAPTTKTTRGRA